MKEENKQCKWGGCKGYGCDICPEPKEEPASCPSGWSEPMSKWKEEPMEWRESLARQWSKLGFTETVNFIQSSIDKAVREELTIIKEKVCQNCKKLV